MELDLSMQHPANHRRRSQTRGPEELKAGLGWGAEQIEASPCLTCHNLLCFEKGLASTIDLAQSFCAWIMQHSTRYSIYNYGSFSCFPRPTRQQGPATVSITPTGSMPWQGWQISTSRITVVTLCVRQSCSPIVCVWFSMQSFLMRLGVFFWEGQ